MMSPAGRALLVEDLDNAALPALADRARAGEFDSDDGLDRLMVHLTLAEELGPEHRDGAGSEDVGWLFTNAVNRKYQ